VEGIDLRGVLKRLNLLDAFGVLRSHRDELLDEFMFEVVDRALGVCDRRSVQVLVETSSSDTWKMWNLLPLRQDRCSCSR
jgi:hypothetical protein